METLSQRLDAVQEKLLSLYEEGSTDLMQQVLHWSLLRQENVLMHFARQKGVRRLGYQPVPTLAVSQEKAKQAIEMELLLASLSKSEYSSEPWTMPETSREMMLAPPANKFKKQGETVEVIFGSDKENAMRYTAWKFVYYMDSKDAWHKTPGHVSHAGLWYYEGDCACFYVDFKDEALKHGSRDWTVIFKNTVFSSVDSVTSSNGSAAPAVPDLGRAPEHRSKRTYGRGASPEPRTSSPKAPDFPDCIPASYPAAKRPCVRGPKCSALSLPGSYPSAVPCCEGTYGECWNTAPASTTPWACASGGGGDLGLRLGLGAGSGPGGPRGGPPPAASAAAATASAASAAAAAATAAPETGAGGAGGGGGGDGGPGREQGEPASAEPGSPVPATCQPECRSTRGPVYTPPAPETAPQTFSAAGAEQGDADSTGDWAVASPSSSSGVSTPRRRTSLWWPPCTERTWQHRPVAGDNFVVRKAHDRGGEVEEAGGEGHPSKPARPHNTSQRRHRPRPPTPSRGSGGAPVIVLLKGNCNQLKCLRHRLRKRYRHLIARISTTWSWVGHDSVQRLGRARILIECHGAAHCTEFLTTVGLPANVEVSTVREL
nr:MAG: E2 protein [Hydrurga leptonyx papillomavirus 2]